MGAGLLYNRCTHRWFWTKQGKAQRWGHAGCSCGLAGPEQCCAQANTIILKIHDFVCILGLVIWGSIITCGSQVFAQQTG